MRILLQQQSPWEEIFIRWAYAADVSYLEKEDKNSYLLCPLQDVHRGNVLIRRHDGQDDCSLRPEVAFDQPVNLIFSRVNRKQRRKTVGVDVGVANECFRLRAVDCKKRLSKTNYTVRS